MYTISMLISFTKRHLFCLLSTRNHQYRFSCEIRVNSVSGQNSFLTFYEVCKAKNCQKIGKRNFSKMNILFYLFLLSLQRKHEVNYDTYYKTVKRYNNFLRNNPTLGFQLKLYSRVQQTLLLHPLWWQLLLQIQLQFSTKIFLELM